MAANRDLGLGAPVGRTPTVGIEGLYATGFWLLDEQREEEAADVFRTMLHLAPQDERAWLGLGECHFRMGQLEIALELYSMGAVEADPTVRCRAARARALRALGRHEEADAAYSDALALAEQTEDGEVAMLSRADR
jgi:Flp pilus assembly protein TadD